MQNIRLIDTETEHYYLHHHYGRLPSVSEILDYNQTFEEMDRLRKWQHKMDKIHGVSYADQCRDEALHRGTALHLAIQNYFSTGVLSDSIWFNAVLPFLKIFSDPTSRIYVEKILCNDSYAGTVDFVAHFCDMITVIDFTTSMRFKKRKWVQRKFLQCAAYGNLISDYKVEQLAVVVVRENSYQFFLEPYADILPQWQECLNHYLSSL